jgi:hypothetical protein
MLRQSNTFFIENVSQQIRNARCKISGYAPYVLIGKVARVKCKITGDRN